MDAAGMAAWMLSRVEADGCLYQEDAVAHLMDIGEEELLRLNDAGNQVLGKGVLAAFRGLTESSVVWDRRERYWRSRVQADGPGRLTD